MVFWFLGDRNETKRIAAVLSLKEMAENASTLMYPHCSQVLDIVWIGLRDSKVRSFYKIFYFDDWSLMLENFHLIL